MSVWQYVALFASAFFGGAAAFYIRKANKEVIRFLMGLTGAYIFGITLIHLLPEVYYSSERWAGPFILLGFLLQIGVEHLSQGIEHGHIHAHHISQKNGQATGLAVSVLLGLSIHCFIEGMPIAGYEQLHEQLEASDHFHGQENDGTNYILFGVMFHKAPAAFALVILLLSAGFRNRNAWLLLFFYAVMSPLGAITAQLLDEYQLMSKTVFALLMAIVVGSFLHISTTILFEAEEHNHKFNWRRSLAVLVGFGLAMLSN